MPTIPHIADLPPARNLARQRLEAVFAETKSIQMTPDCKRKPRKRLIRKPNSGTLKYRAAGLPAANDRG
jgi:hypothetical protein